MYFPFEQKRCFRTFETSRFLDFFCFSTAREKIDFFSFTSAPLHSPLPSHIPALPLPFHPSVSFPPSCRSKNINTGTSNSCSSVYSFTFTWERSQLFSVRLSFFTLPPLSLLPTPLLPISFIPLSFSLHLLPSPPLPSPPFSSTLGLRLRPLNKSLRPT